MDYDVTSQCGEWCISPLPCCFLLVFRREPFVLFFLSQQHCSTVSTLMICVCVCARASCQCIEVLSSRHLYASFSDAWLTGTHTLEEEEIKDKEKGRGGVRWEGGGPHAFHTHTHTHTHTQYTHNIRVLALAYRNGRTGRSETGWG